MTAKENYEKVKKLFQTKRLLNNKDSRIHKQIQIKNLQINQFYKLVSFLVRGMTQKLYTNVEK